jgi:transposase
MIRRRVAEEPAFYFSSDLGRSPMSDFYDRVDKAVGDWDELARPLFSAFNRTFGRPTDPVMYLKMFLLGYFQNAVYDTRLSALCADSMAIRRFLGLSLVDRVPDHSSLSRVRHSLADEADLEQVLDLIVARCVRAGLVGGKALHVDATLVRANASIRQLCSLDSGRSVAEHLKEARQKNVKPEVKNSEFYSPADPEARIRQKGKDKAQMCYLGTHVTDSSHQVIVSARMDYGDSAEIAASLPAVSQAVERLEEMGESPEVVVADKGYGKPEFHNAVEALGVRPATFYPREHEPQGRFAHGDFVFDAGRDVYICPLGKELKPQARKDNRMVYKSKVSDCKGCPLRDMCLGAKADRKEVSRTDGIEARERNRAYVSTAEGKKHLRRRSTTVEPPFGHMKRYGGLERLNCRGLAKARAKLLFAAAAWNIQKLVKHAGRSPAVSLPDWKLRPDTPKGTKPGRKSGNAALIWLQRQMDAMLLRLRLSLSPSQPPVCIAGYAGAPA